MNCKQGDLAVIVRSSCGNEGKVVHCIRLFTNTFSLPDGALVSGPTWEVDPPVRGWNGLLIPGVRDALLRPLRDGEGEDEMLRLVGLPNVDAPQAA